MVSTDRVIRHGMLNVARNRALTMLARSHPEEFALITRRVWEELGIAEFLEKPCACGGVIRKAGRGRWPTACRECKEKQEEKEA